MDSWVELNKLNIPNWCLAYNKYDDADYTYNINDLNIGYKDTFEGYPKEDYG